MVTQQIIDYIKSQRQLGKNDEIIKRKLETSAWKSSDINEAFTPIDSKSSVNATNTASIPISQSAPTQSQAIFTNQPDISTNSSASEIPKVIRVISFLITIIAILYAFSVVRFLGIAVIMDRALSGGDLLFPLLKYFPTLGILPILFSLIASIFFYLALKIRNGSRFSFSLGIITLLIIPITSALLSMWLLSSFLIASGASEEMGGETMLSQLANSATPNVGDPIIIISFVSLIVLLVSSKKFSLPNNPISKKAKVVLASLSAVLLTLSISVVLIGYIKASDSDFGYTKAKTQVTYHVYKPTIVPAGLVNTTKYITGNELGGMDNAVQVAFDTPFVDRANNSKQKMIVLKQVGVSPGYDLKGFVSREFKEAAITEPISLSTAANQQAYLATKELQNMKLLFLSYTTQDNVLIFVSAVNTSKDEILEFAQSLK